MNEIICGINSVYEAIKASRRKVLAVYVTDGKQGPNVTKIIELATSKGVKVKELPKSKIFDLTRVETNQGVAAEVEHFKYLTIEELVGTIQKADKRAFIVILDQVNDPHNLGAIIRTAHLLGADGVVIPKDNAAQINSTVSKAASGAIEYLPIIKVVNISNCINYLKNNNIWIVGADGDVPKTIYDYDFTSSCGVVLGGEGRGLRRLTKEYCDELLAIPMFGKVGSYNVSVAGAIFMAEVVRQRLPAGLAKNMPKSSKNP